MMTQQKPVVCLGILVAGVVGRPLDAMPAAGSLVLVDEMGQHVGSKVIWHRS